MGYDDTPNEIPLSLLEEMKRPPIHPIVREVAAFHSGMHQRVGRRGFLLGTTTLR